MSGDGTSCQASPGWDGQVYSLARATRTSFADRSSSRREHQAESGLTRSSETAYQFVRIPMFLPAWHGMRKTVRATARNRPPPRRMPAVGRGRKETAMLQIHDGQCGMCAHFGEYHAADQ